jgi:hypothetical protein
MAGELYSDCPESAPGPIVWGGSWKVFWYGRHSGDHEKATSQPIGGLPITPPPDGAPG